MNNTEQKLEAILQIQKAFKTILGHLKQIPIKEFNRAKKQALYLQYDIQGLYMGATRYEYGGDITIKINDIKNKQDIQRYVNLKQEELELQIIKYDE